MIKTISDFFYSKTKLVLIVLLLFIIFAMFQIMPVFEKVLNIDDNIVSMDSADILPQEMIYSILTDWGDDGRVRQVWFHLSWDLIFPVSYFFFVGFLLSWFAKRGFKSNSSMQKLNLLAFVAVVDLLENISIMILVFVYPADIFFLVFVKNALTVIKYYLFGPLIVLGLLLSLVFAAKNRFEIQD